MDEDIDVSSSSSYDGLDEDRNYHLVAERNSKIQNLRMQNTTNLTKT